MDKRLPEAQLKTNSICEEKTHVYKINAILKKYICHSILLAFLNCIQNTKVVQLIAALDVLKSVLLEKWYRLATMKVFQIIRKLSHIIGIDLSSIDIKHSINFRSFACVLSKVVFFATSLAYLYLKAVTPQEYGSEYCSSFYNKKNDLCIYQIVSLFYTGETFFICATEFSIEIIYLSVFVNIKNLNNLIEKFEVFTQKSESWEIIAMAMGNVICIYKNGNSIKHYHKFFNLIILNWQN